MTDKYKEIPIPAKKQSFQDDDDAVVEVTLDEVSPIETAEEPVIEPVAEEKPKVEKVAAAPPQKRESRSQKRIQQLANEKRALLEEREQLIAEREEYRKQASATDKRTQADLKSALESKIQLIQVQMREAIKQGDSDQVVELQDQLFDAKADLKDLTKTLVKEEVGEKPIRKAPEEKIAERALEWIEAHPEFTTDELFHASALIVNNQLLKEGFDVNSEEFYEELDTRLSKRFPEVFGIQKENSVQSNQGTKSQTSDSVEDVKSEPKQIVSGSSRPASAGNVHVKKSQTSVKLTQADIAQAERWGLSLEQMARRMAHVETNKDSTGYVPIQIKK